MVSPPRSGITLALSTAYMGGSGTQVTSVCQPSASGGLSAVSSMVDVSAVPPSIFVSGYGPTVPKCDANSDLLRLVEVLAVEEQDGVLVQRVAQRLRGGVVERDGEVDVVDDGTDAAGDGRDRDHRAWRLRFRTGSMHTLDPISGRSMDGRGEWRVPGSARQARGRPCVREGDNGRARRRSEFDELQKRSGTTRETWTIQEGPDGSALVLVWFECDDPEKTFVELAQDPSEFANWFRAKVKDITGVDLTEPAEGAPDLVVDWSA